MPLPPDFYDQVYQVARLIPKGKVSTYGAIATYLGMPKASRMVGYAMHHALKQTIPVPAHRVVNRNGLLSGRHHFHHPDEMQELLEKEGLTIQDHAIIHFQQHFWDPAIQLAL